MHAGFGQGQKQERNPEQLVFHAQCGEEFDAPPNLGPGYVQHMGLKPQYRDYLCGVCGSNTTGRVLCDVKRPSDGGTVSWCLCACDKKEPTVIVESESGEKMQLPHPKQFRADPGWPKELGDLYEEAAKSFAATAYTAASMVCRKILMSSVCHEQAKANETVEEGKSFTFYVDYLANKFTSFPEAKSPIDAIRSIGNDANHHVQFVTHKEAERALTIVGHLLTFMYAFSQS